MSDDLEFDGDFLSELADVEDESVSRPSPTAPQEGEPMTAKTVKTYKFTDICTDSRLQLRRSSAATLETVVREYADAIKAGERLPPIEVFDVNDVGDDEKHEPGLYIVDGHLRMTAYESVNAKSVDCVVVGKGTMRDAQIYVLSVNTKHGMRRTSAETTLAVRKAYELMGPKTSQREIAKLCNISHVHVGRILRDAADEAAGRVAQKKDRRAKIGVNAARDDSTTTVSDDTGDEVADFQPDELCDASGHPVPESLRDSFTARQRLVMAESSRLAMLRFCKEASELLMHDADKRAIAHITDTVLEKLFNDIQAITPQAVCQKCGGAGCKHCHGRGYSVGR